MHVPRKTAVKSSIHGLGRCSNDEFKSPLVYCNLSWPSPYMRNLSGKHSIMKALFSFLYTNKIKCQKQKPVFVSVLFCFLLIIYKSIYGAYYLREVVV